MICHLCKSNVHKVHKVVKKVKIYECLDCLLDFVDQVVSFKSRSDKDDTNGLYNFAAYKVKEKKLRKTFAKLTDIIVKYKKSGRVLDVGAGYGFFSSILHKKGNFLIETIEPNTDLYYLQNIPHTNNKKTLEDYLKWTNQRDRAILSKHDRSKRYDIIILMDLIEHLRNPMQSLKKLRELLTYDGILVIQTPNYMSLMARICRDWAWWMIEDHKFFFTVKSLQKILNKTRFKTEYFLTYEDWYDFKKNLDGNFAGIKNNYLRKLKKGIFLIFFAPFYYMFRQVIWGLGYGGLMFVIAKKK